MNTNLTLEQKSMAIEEYCKEHKWCHEGCKLWQNKEANKHNGKFFEPCYELPDADVEKNYEIIFGKKEEPTPPKHYWARHSMITPLGKKLVLGWSCPHCHQVVGEPYPFCPYCGEPLLDPDKEDQEDKED